MSSVTLTTLLQDLGNEMVDDTTARSTVLVNLLRKNKYWPALQVKRFFNNPNLVLLHNTYKREDTESFQTLYDECRSVVLNLSALDGQPIVVSYANSIPDRISDINYDIIKSDTDHVSAGYEGTMVAVYHYDGVWYFGTTSCPSIDSSRFFHPTKTHGRMFDEALSKLLNEPVPVSKQTSQNLRKKFTDTLDVTKAYSILLVHHENKHIIDYTSELGQEYAVLINIAVRNRETLEITTDDALSQMLVSSKTFESPDSGLSALRNENLYALIVSKEGKTYKVCTTAIIDAEEKSHGNHNVWQNMLYVYMKNRSDYKIQDYLKQNEIQLDIPKTSKGREIAPTYLIHTLVCNMMDILHNAYKITTVYNVNTRKCYINKKMDTMYPPIIRFHLAQMRNLQTSVYPEQVLTLNNVYNYICKKQSIKNIRLLINHFATVCKEAVNGYMTIPYGLQTHVAECFIILDSLLSVK